MSQTAPLPARTEPAPNTEIGTLSRQWLSEAEVERLIKAAANERDALMVLMAYRHGLRVSELIGLTWSQIDLDAGRVRVLRLKDGEDGVHPLSGREIRGLRKLRRAQVVSRHVFLSNRKAPMTARAFYKLLALAGARAGLDGVHPHLLRHATGFKLVNDGMDSLSLAAYLGHKNINNTRRYTKMDARRFDGVWRD